MNKQTKQKYPLPVSMYNNARIKYTNPPNITKYQIRWKDRFGYFLPSKEVPLLRMGYEYLRKTGFKYIITYKDRSGDKNN